MADTVHELFRGSAEPESLELRLEIRDRELVAELGQHREGRQRDDFATAALRIGVLALRQVRGQLDSQTVRGEFDRMLGELRSGLDEHQRALGERLSASLREYFDPESGRFAERVDRLTHEDGELASVIRRQVSGDGSALVRTLGQHFGPESALLRVLDPQSAGGLAAALEKTVNEELERQSAAILAEFSLDNRDGSLARLVGELRAEHGKLTDDLGDRIGELVREFSLDEEGSALSRLVQRVERAQQRIAEEFSLDSDSSALARIRRELMEVSRAQTEKITQMERTVATEMAALTARRSEAQRSTAHGDDFEEAVASLLEAQVRRSGDVFERTGRRVGRLKNCKKGDAVVELGPEHRAAGARIVIEAKDDKSFGMARARAELDQARKNRGAEHGVFVFSSTTAPAGTPCFERIGADVFVTWDPDDPQTDVFLEAALSLCRALCTRRSQERDQEVDLDTLDRAIREIEKQAQGLDEIKRSAQTIESGSEKILNRVRIMSRSLAQSVETLDQCSAATRAALA